MHVNLHVFGEHKEMCQPRCCEKPVQDVFYSTQQKVMIKNLTLGHKAILKSKHHKKRGWGQLKKKTHQLREIWRWWKQMMETKLS